MKCLIRRARIEDAKAIHLAHMKSIQDVCSKDHSPEEIKAWGHRPYDETRRQYSINNDYIWVVDEQNTIEGYGHLKIYEKDGIHRGHIYALYLTTKVLKKNLGRSIIDLMLIEAKKSKVEEITLEATLTAHQFYKKMGFQDSGNEMKVEINGHMIRCYPMIMRLYY